jgi:hypothetical protein
MADTDPRPLRARKVPEGVVLTFRGWERTIITYDRVEIDRLLSEVASQPLKQDLSITPWRRARP